MCMQPVFFIIGCLTEAGNIRLLQGVQQSGWRVSSEKGCSCKYKGSIVQELCESRGGRPGLSVLTSLLVSVDVKLY